mmetsp:Transcript_39611/g.90971  ORF Transcript_39611/g.90971 Transcript_39611/m.90971 type:complete len:264 (+) Transcript_39611:479-1270(+)
MRRTAAACPFSQIWCASSSTFCCASFASLARSIFSLYAAARRMVASRRALRAASALSIASHSFFRLNSSVTLCSLKSCATCRARARLDFLAVDVCGDLGGEARLDLGGEWRRSSRRSDAAASFASSVAPASSAEVRSFSFVAAATAMACFTSNCALFTVACSSLSRLLAALAWRSASITSRCFSDIAMSARAAKKASRRRSRRARFSAASISWDSRLRLSFFSLCATFSASRCFIAASMCRRRRSASATRSRSRCARRLTAST